MPERSLAVKLAVLAGAGAGLLAASNVLALRWRNPATTAMIRLREREVRAEGRSLVLQQRWVPLDAVAPVLREAVLQVTDSQFYRHGGVNWGAIGQAWRANRQAGWKAYGGSTITVQVVKNLYFHPRKSYARKVAEVPLAYLMEALLGKDRILEIYLNIAEWGDGIFGVEAAAQFYFGKPATEISLREASLLAAVLPNPRRWSPLKPTLLMVARAAQIRRLLTQESQS